MRSSTINARRWGRNRLCVTGLPQKLQRDLCIVFTFSYLTRWHLCFVWHVNTLAGNPNLRQAACSLTKKVNMPFTTITRPEPGKPKRLRTGWLGATTSLLMMPKPCPVSDPPHAQIAAHQPRGLRPADGRSCTRRMPAAALWRAASEADTRDGRAGALPRYTSPRVRNRQTAHSPRPQEMPRSPPNSTSLLQAR